MVMVGKCIRAYQAQVSARFYKWPIPAKVINIIYRVMNRVINIVTKLLTMQLPPM